MVLRVGEEHAKSSLTGVRGLEIDLHGDRFGPPIKLSHVAHHSRRIRTICGYREALVDLQDGVAKYGRERLLYADQPTTIFTTATHQLIEAPQLAQVLIGSI
jgi:hypothetical protein